MENKLIDNPAQQAQAGSVLNGHTNDFGALKGNDEWCKGREDWLMDDSSGSSEGSSVHG